MTKRAAAEIALGALLPLLSPVSLTATPIDRSATVSADTAVFRLHTRMKRTVTRGGTLLGTGTFRGWRGRRGKFLTRSFTRGGVTRGTALAVASDASVGSICFSFVVGRDARGSFVIRGGTGRGASLHGSGSYRVRARRDGGIRGLATGRSRRGRSRGLTGACRSLDPKETNPAPTPNDPVIAAAGDIACDPASTGYSGGVGTATRCHQRAVSDLLVERALAGVLTLGDHQYENDVYSNYLQVFDPTWGRVKSLIHPAIGNHEYLTAGAAGYFDYFNGVTRQSGAAGDRSRAYYSYEVGAWHIIALNSNCSLVGGCGTGSAQNLWLRRDLAAHRSRCTLAYFHHPRFTSGSPGTNTAVQPLWQALYEADADLVLNGHAHVYERFAPQTPAGTLDTTRGIREFVVGTGGRSHHSFITSQPNTEVRDNRTFGILELKLHPASFEWRFVPEAGGTLNDAGLQACH